MAAASDTFLGTRHTPHPTLSHPTIHTAEHYLKGHPCKVTRKPRCCAARHVRTFTPPRRPQHPHFPHTIYYSVNWSSQCAIGSRMNRYCCCRRRRCWYTPFTLSHTIFLLGQLVLPVRNGVLHEAVLLLPPPPLVERRRHADAPPHRAPAATAAPAAAPHAAAELPHALPGVRDPGLGAFAAADAAAYAVARSAGG